MNGGPDWSPRTLQTSQKFLWLTYSLRSYIIHCIYCCTVTKYQFYFITYRYIAGTIGLCIVLMAFSKFFAYIAHFIAYLSDFIEIMWPPSAKSNLNWVYITMWFHI